MLEDSSASLHAQRQRKRNMKRGTAEWVTFNVEETPVVPDYWSEHQGSSLLDVLKSTFLNQEYKKVTLQEKSKGFIAIVQLVNDTFKQNLVGQGSDAKGLDKLGYKTLVVKKIERIENAALYQDYFKRRQKMFLSLKKNKHVNWPNISSLPQNNGDIATASLRETLHMDIYPEVNEVFVFHGAKKDYIKAICNDGFDPRVGNKNAMFGSGVYGAEKSTKADQYTGSKHISDFV